MEKGYNSYLKSAKWRGIRLLVLKRDNYKCVDCGSKIKLVIHHKTYLNIFNEEEHLSDLKTLCEKCHSETHKKANKNNPKNKRKKIRPPRPPRPPMSERKLMRSVYILSETDTEYNVQFVCNGEYWTMNKSECKQIAGGKFRAGRWMFLMQFPRLLWKDLQAVRRKRRKARNLIRRFS